MIEAALTCREKYLQAAYTIERELQNIDKYKGQIAQLTAAVDGLRESISYDVREIYGFDLYVKQW